MARTRGHRHGFRLTGVTAATTSSHAQAAPDVQQYKSRTHRSSGWWFVENKRPIPPQGSPGARQEGGLGAAGLYLATSWPSTPPTSRKLLGRRVSHGCIRLSNENAVRLFHNVQIGTPVVIVGQAPVLGAQPDSVAAYTRQARRVPVRPNPLARVATAALLTRLDRELAAPDTSHAWVNTAHTLLERGLGDDAAALRGLLQRAGQGRSTVRREEYATFVADAFRAAPARGRLAERIRRRRGERAASAIVEARWRCGTGGLDESTAPGPRPPPQERLGSGRAGPDGSREAAEARGTASVTGRAPRPPASVMAAAERLGRQDLHFHTHVRRARVRWSSWCRSRRSGGAGGVADHVSRRNLQARLHARSAGRVPGRLEEPPVFRSGEFCWCATCGTRCRRW